ncbi:MAG: 30S ribosomal protein S13 [bacterium]|nr:30S ribosomal protein S13 [bacterium]
MARIAGVNIPEEKRIEASLQYVYGIGLTKSKEILAGTGIDPSKRTKDLSEAELTKLREYITKNYTIEGDLRRETSVNVSRLKAINAYRGVRHKLGLPVRGQRTKTNSRTKRGKRMAVGSGKKKSAAKT